MWDLVCNSSVIVSYNDYFHKASDALPVRGSNICVCT